LTDDVARPPYRATADVLDDELLHYGSIGQLKVHLNYHRARTVRVQAPEQRSDQTPNMLLVPA